jgi:hypothetical protein
MLALVYAAADVPQAGEAPEVSSSDATLRQRVLRELREAIAAATVSAGNGIMEVGGQPRRSDLAMANGGATVDADLAQMTSALRSVEVTLYALQRKQPLREFTFPNRVPVLGGLIARLQEQVGRISAKWYSRFILQQQNEINTLMLLCLQQLLGTVQLMVRSKSRLSSNTTTTADITAHLLVRQQADIIGLLSALISRDTGDQQFPTQFASLLERTRAIEPRLSASPNQRVTPELVYLRLCELSAVSDLLGEVVHEATSRGPRE